MPTRLQNRKGRRKGSFYSRMHKKKRGRVPSFKSPSAFMASDAPVYKTRTGVAMKEKRTKKPTTLTNIRIHKTP